MSETFSVAGCRTLVTGASSGIGRAIAEEFARDGAPVAICSREEGNVATVAESIREEGGETHAFECDVREETGVDAFVNEAAEALGGIDCLVNNAGASFMASFEDISENGWNAVVDTNLTGTRNSCRAAAGRLADGGGCVVNLSSAAGEAGAPYMSHYGAAKAGVINLTASLADEWADDDVRVNCIAPGFVATPGLESQMGIAADEVDRASVDRRIGLPEEIADVARFLASDAASFVTGETIVPRGKPDLVEVPEA
ncbi:MAG: SDR family NAD(P)-dependent oxidoreductase [Haloarculaceae archaeon]